MFKKGDYVVYRRNVCKITDIKKEPTNNLDCYLMIPIDDESLTINVPTITDKEHLKAIISKTEVESLIKKIPDIKVIVESDTNIETEYKKLLGSNSHEDLIQIIKTTYLRNEARKKDGKKMAQVDTNYFKKAEQKLYNEFSISLGMEYAATKKYVLQKLKTLEKN